ncbi:MULTISPECIES: PQQ-binding-like beta-propeller repeat protein [Halobacterium]|uniref:outer membrane protein assembly factor BamB family protein n=1 Tax=Halobacterium TaxID=2239 RepID=UPI00073ECFBD|nr:MULTISPECIES: PQQ-binding-like beta-propeller repeat protein [Halobacterium]MCG1004408.1 PQQ-binding-like beta-propeller repeat protein [Halobacterium noricense]
MSRRRFSRRALLGALGAAAAATAGCVAPADAPESSQPGQSTESEREISLASDAGWTTYGYTNAHTGHNPEASGVAGDPTQVWEGFVDGIYTLREPAVADGRLFVGSGESMWAFDAETGDPEWDTDLGALPHQYPPTHRDGTLFVVAKQSGGVNTDLPGSVRALDPADGSQQWRTDLPVTSTVAHDGDRLYVAAKADEKGYVQALDPDTGERGWRFDVPDASRSYVLGSPASVDDTLYVTATHLADDGTTTGALYALDPENGDVSWSLETDAALPFAPVVADDRIHVVARDGTVHAVSTAGEREWTADAGGRVYTRPTYADGRLFVLTVDDIVAYDDGGDEDWRGASDRTQLTGMAVGGDTLYVGGEPLFALDAATGDVQFELTEDVFHLTYGAPIVVDDVLYAGICIKDEAGAMYDNSVRAFV